MSKKNYVKLAAMLARARSAWATGWDTSEPADIIEGIEVELMAYLFEDNPRFDAARFRDAARTF